LNTINTNSYPVLIGKKCWGEMSRFIEQKFSGSKIIVVADSNTLLHCYPLLEDNCTVFLSAEVIEIPEGEENKNIDIAIGIWETLLQLEADRSSLIVNLGGGVVSDIGSFAASTYKRGIKFINIPTTLLAQVDASVGGKTGIDLNGIKNQIGTFCNPDAVFINPEFLNTLPAPQLLSGFAEVIKHALITDKNYWKYIISENPTEITDWEKLISQSVIIKNKIVTEDPYESGIRKLLNFGHTIGHAVESYSLETDNPLLHGEAIAIGMICESYISSKLCGLKEPELLEISNYISGLFEPYWLDETIYHKLLQLMMHDKKNENGKIYFSLIESIGSGIYGVSCNTDIITESLDFYKSITVTE
jgi:3-dehydroquinate synthase